MWMGTPSHRRSKAACGLSKPTHRRCRAACGWDKPSHRRSELHVAWASPLTAALDLHVVGSRPVTAALSTQGTRQVMQLKCYMQRVSNVVGIGRKGGAKSKQASRARQRGTRATKDDRTHGQARASSSSRRARRRTEAVDVLWPSAGSRAACLSKLAPAAVIRPPAIWSHRALSSPWAAGPGRAPAAPRAARRVAVVRSVSPASAAPCPPASKALVLPARAPGRCPDGGPGR